MQFAPAPLLTACATALLCALGPSAGAARAAPAPGFQRLTPAAFPQPQGWPAIESASKSEEPVGPGVTYQRWELSTQTGPLTLSIATVDLSNPYVALSVVTQRDAIVGPDEPLSAMADRARAELGINADYFDIGESGSPLNVVVEGGRILHQPDGAAAFLVGVGNRITMGPVSFQATIIGASGTPLAVGAVNDWGRSTPVALLTAELGSTEASGAAEIVLTPTGEPDRYRVSNVGANLATLLPLRPQDLGVAAHDPSAVSALADFVIGDAVAVTFQAPGLDSVREAVGGGPLLVRDGAPFDDPVAPAREETNARYPLSGAGLSADGKTLWLVVVDGRAPGRSIGLTRPQLASLFVALGASQAMAFDSGGSSEMVVRRLGDQRVSVANLPSDGHERRVADGIFVVNSAAPGSPAAVLVALDAPALLAGSSLRLRTRAVDANLQPVAVDAASVRYSLDSPATARISGDMLVALKPGGVKIGAEVDGVKGAAYLEVVDRVAHVSIEAPLAHVPAGASEALSVEATTAAGEAIAVDKSAVRWSVSGGGGRVDGAGVFHAGAADAIATITATAGGAAASLRLPVGEHALTVQQLPLPGEAPGRWRYLASPSVLPGGVDGEPAPDGVPALRLAYDFSGGSGTRAAYAQTEVPILGEPLALQVDVYGDGEGEWLRGAYRNADGIADSVSLARHVDWHGWKTLRVNLPPQVRFPIAWTRLYAVETASGAKEQGSLWFRNLRLVYAGPWPQKKQT